MVRSKKIIFDLMTTQQLNRYLTNPSVMNAQDLEVIKELCFKYSYSPVFAMLYAKVLHNLSDLSYDEALRRAAIVLPDRSVLYQLIYKETLDIEEKQIQEEESEEKTINVVVQNDSIVNEVTTNTEFKEMNLSVVENDLSVDKEEEDIVEIDELGQDVLIEAINTSIQLDVNQLLNEEVSDSIEGWKDQKAIEEIKPMAKEVPEDTSNYVTTGKFSDWLFAMKDVNEDDSNREEESQLLSSADLIERFIRTKPRKIDVTKDPLTPQEMGKLSLVEDDAFVTETLAEIYAKQGKYQKAIKIYEQLSLKNPEKKIFFASRIRFLREKLEYDN